MSKTVYAVRNGTDKGRWWANPDFGSELWLLRQAGKVDGTTAGNVRSMILECTTGGRERNVNDGTEFPPLQVFLSENLEKMGFDTLADAKYHLRKVNSRFAYGKTRGKLGDNGSSYAAI